LKSSHPRDIRPLAAITAGDPCGIGPDVILQSIASLDPRLRWVVIGDLRVFERTARRLRRCLPAWRIARTPAEAAAGSSRLTFLDCRHPGRFTPGRTSPAAGRASLAYLRHAVALWRGHGLTALITAPVTKWTIQAAMPRFVGHTEYLTAAMRARHTVMMFAAERLRVVLLTRHVPLRDVTRSLTPALVSTTLRVTAAALRRQFGIARPRLAVCGVNPHAGEAGVLGTHEQRVMIPVLRRLRASGLRCDGPFPADGFFAQAHPYDAVVCAYHDQGLIPFKMAARDEGCQVTLGLPLVRTSPDHGTALDIAARGRANPGSMRYALRLAARLTLGTGT
jgi:4-hydroxythreonine-4-phosphate dehydrogenase